MSISGSEPLGRRGFITGQKQGLLRPPWTNEQAVKENCTSCGACISACPEGILIEGPAKTPQVDFTYGACTFCQKCAEVCDDGVFAEELAEPWALTASIKPSCMLHMGISCQICADACMDDALKFSYLPAPSGEIKISPDACTGCGACISVCPSDAIELVEKQKEIVDA